jgi:hypothetical protein
LSIACLQTRFSEITHAGTQPYQTASLAAHEKPRNTATSHLYIVFESHGAIHHYYIYIAFHTKLLLLSANRLRSAHPLIYHGITTSSTVDYATVSTVGSRPMRPIIQCRRIISLRACERECMVNRSLHHAPIMANRHEFPIIEMNSLAVHFRPYDSRCSEFCRRMKLH